MRKLFTTRYLTPYAIVSGIVALALLYLPALQPVHTPGLTAIAVGAAIAIGQLEYRRRRAERLVASLNGRLLKLVSTLDKLRVFMNGETFKALPRGDRQQLREVESDLGNLTAVIKGFRDLDDYIQEVAARVRRDG